MNYPRKFENIVSRFKRSVNANKLWFIAIVVGGQFIYRVLRKNKKVKTYTYED